jgi:hypothetical protein
MKYPIAPTQMDRECIKSPIAIEETWLPGGAFDVKLFHSHVPRIEEIIEKLVAERQ